MTYFLDEIKDNYVTQKGGFKHTTPERAVLFPYITTPPSKSILNELKNFHGICGEVVRQLRGIKPTELFNNELFLKKIQNKFDFDKPEDGLQLQKILLKTIFTRDKELHCFHPKIFYYKSSKDSGTQKNLKSIGGFLASVFFTKNPDLLTDYRDITVENVFHDLILNSLPPLEESPNLISKKNFLKIDVGINECFLKDLKLITDNPKLSTKFLPELIKFYYLMYQLRLIEKLNYLFDETNLEPFYFSLDWERLSKERRSYQEGWQRIKHTKDNEVDSKLFTMFSHAHCIELLSYIPFKGLEPPYSYPEIKNWMQKASDQEKSDADEALKELLFFYEDNISNLNFHWTDHTEQYSNTSDEIILGKIEQLYKMILVQFKVSNRKAAAQKYSRWFSEFVTENYMKNRGRIGNTLAFNRRQLMFLTRLCIGANEKKIRLLDLWAEFAQRGVIFDYDSQRQVVRLFETLNLLEKKSDSGDAQYVRSSF